MTAGRPRSRSSTPALGKALLGDFAQLARLGKLFGVLMPGLDIKSVLAELRERVAEELDYLREAEAQHAFALEFHDDPDFHVPDVIAANETVLVTEWMDGVPLSRVITEGTKEERDRAGLLFVRFLFCSPARVGMLHADPPTRATSACCPTASWASSTSAPSTGAATRWRSGSSPASSTRATWTP
ncbi:AarF/UbiB family protein [Nonomuraea ferruginea]